MSIEMTVEAPQAIEQLRQSRAVLRTIKAGSFAACEYCDEPIEFRAKTKALQVICNIYEEGKWKAAELYHEGCYGSAEAPYGPADISHVQPIQIGGRVGAAALNNS